MSDTETTSSPQQLEAARFRSAVSEALLQSLQGNVNFLLGAISPIGTIIQSLLSESDFLDQFPSSAADNWVLMDGQDISSSAFAVLTGITAAPDWRGRYPRMKDGGAGVDSHGDLALGTTYADQQGAHTHSLSVAIPAARFSAGGGQTHLLYGTNEELVQTGSFPGTGTSGSTGGSETNPKTGVCNFFLKVN